VCFCLPHQFLKPMMPSIKAAAAPGVKCLSAIKGIDFDDSGIVLISDILRKELSADCSVLMGANVANDMASDAFCETTIGYTNYKNGELFKLAYNDPALKVGIVKDTVGVELCGALKNIVAIGAGFVDGLGYGGNTKAAIIRIGLKEMVKFQDVLRWHPGRYLPRELRRRRFDHHLLRRTQPQVRRGFRGGQQDEEP